ncbi:MAG: hypothetical protein SFV24_10615 [Gemmatimonadales bacterium]|nr:hypothetical protein [Gemmatimonadales bacterium]
MTTEPNDRLATAYQRLLAERPRGAHCPAPERLARWASPEGVPEPELLEGLDHVMGCEGCRREYETLRGIAAAAGSDGASLAESPNGAIPRIGASRWTRWLPLAAAVVLSVGGVAIWRLRAPAGPDSVVRDGPDGSALQAVAPTDSIVPTGIPPRFEWRSVPTAVGYRFELLRDDGAPVAVVETTDSTATVADSVRLTPGRYLWVVMATTAGGDVVRLVRPLTAR